MNPQKINQARKTLQLKETATPAEIKKQYHKLTKKHHPDQTNPKNNKKMQEINQAYQLLQQHIQQTPIPLTPQTIKETKTTHQKHIESFTQDWMWTPHNKKTKK